MARFACSDCSAEVPYPGNWNVNRKLRCKACRQVHKRLVERMRRVGKVEAPDGTFVHERAVKLLRTTLPQLDETSARKRVAEVDQRAAERLASNQELTVIEATAFLAAKADKPDPRFRAQKARTIGRAARAQKARSDLSVPPGPKEVRRHA